MADNKSDLQSQSRLATSVKIALDSVKAVVIAGIGIVGVLFFVFNWDKFTEMLNNLSRFEGFGVKIELHSRTTENFIITSGTAKQGYLTREQHRLIQLRANWILPLLASSTLLWVDDRPELLNNEIQFLTSYRVSIRLARSTQQALDELKKSEFDLVISDISRQSEPSGPADKCPVHWFVAPRQTEDLEAFNKRYNAALESGFYLAERMRKEIADLKRPPIIFYSGYAQPVATPCSDMITSDTYTIFNSIFDHLERRRSQVFERYNPPWAPKPQTKK